MTIEERGRSAGRETLQAFESWTDVVIGFDGLVDRRHAQRRNRALGVAVAVIVAVLTVFAVQGTLSADSTREPMKPVPGMEVGDVPVWYDDAGLHHGDVVEQTPVELREMDGDAIKDGALALVRTGALYLDPATDDVWFQPWGGEPRIVGHNSSTGPSANPDGDIAAWFEGGQLVVFDTVTGQEIARTVPSWRTERPFDSDTCHTGCLEHDQPGNGFLQVSAERVVWTASEGHGPSYIFDVRTGEVSRVANFGPADAHDGAVVDVQDDAAVVAVDDKINPWGWHLVLDMPGGAPQDYPKVNPRSRFSPSGKYVLSDGTWVGGMGERDAPAIIDTTTGSVWPVPGAGFTWTAWSYGDIALVDTHDGLLVCDAANRTCQLQPVEGPLLMPTN